MLAKTRFLKWFQKAPRQARVELVCDYSVANPMTLNVICIEIKNDTKLGKKLLERLGFEDD